MYFIRNLTGILIFILLMFLGNITKAQSFQKIKNGIKVNISHQTIVLEFYKNKVIRVLKYPERKTPEKRSFSVVEEPQDVRVKIAKVGNVLNVSDNYITVCVDLSNGSIKFLNAKGEEFLKEKPESNIFLPCKDSLENGYAVEQGFQLTPEEAIYGLGQHQTGILNKRNQNTLLKQNNRLIAIPYFYSTNGYGLFWDNTSTTLFKDNNTGTYFNSEVGNCIDYYVLKSDNAYEGLAEWRGLTGKAPMLPLWAFGYWQSRERYKYQKEVLNVVKKYRQLNVPLDVIVQDWQYWGKGNNVWNAVEFNNSNYPNPAQMIDSIHQQNTHIAISVWPSFGKDTKIYKALDKENLLLKGLAVYPASSDVVAYDPFSARARDIYWDFMNKNLFSKGIDGWWLDATEPDQMKPNSSDNDINTSSGLFGKVRNAFPISTVGGVFNHQRKQTNDKRVVILTRSAFAGQQRYSAINWSGDIHSNWKTLKVQVANGLNMSYSGIPYWNTDIGGFFSHSDYPKGVKDPGFKELYVRWLEFGTFCPIMRSHGTETPREIYQFGPENSWPFKAIKKFIDLRYTLLPYLYSNAWQVTKDGSTFMRALEMDYPNDTATKNISNEYLFGPAFLVNPVTKPMYTMNHSEIPDAILHEVKSWRTYLPKGNNWFNFWTGESISGGQVIETKVPIDEIPLFVKAGSILPIGPIIQYAEQKKSDTLELRIYPGANGKFNLYEDEMDNYNYQKGKYAIISFTWNDKNRFLSISKRKGSFSGILKNKVFKIILVSKNNGIGISNSDNVGKIVHYRGKQEYFKF